MSFFLKQAINAFTTQTSDLQTVLDLKADAEQTYTKTDVNNKLLDLIDTAPVALSTLKALADTTMSLEPPTHAAQSCPHACVQPAPCCAGCDSEHDDSMTMSRSEWCRVLMLGRTTRHTPDST